MSTHAGPHHDRECLRRECDARPGWPAKSTRPVPFLETETDQPEVDESETPRVVDAVTVGGVL